MKSIYLVVFALIVLGCTPKQESSPTDGLLVRETVSAITFKQKLDSTQQAILLDVRTQEEVARGHIEGAINIDYKGDDFKEKVNQLDRNKPYFIYCGSGIRSQKAGDIMSEMNFKIIYELDGGLSSWGEAGFAQVPIEKN